MGTCKNQGCARYAASGGICNPCRIDKTIDHVKIAPYVELFKVGKLTEFCNKVLLKRKAS